MTRHPDEPPTVDRMRIDIDRGRTGDKVSVEDPAMAPLGTDAEAGGFSPTRAERRIEAQARPASPPKDRSSRTAPYLLWAAGLALSLLLVFAMLNLE